ncbi:MAG: hypothetical protein CVU11_00775 [Bacteroidetes bacterium HGW-Bacteroidetes-6]|jgi:putative endonuclease|nr:MAG: hypothetical protein CVU11_00775 [Bacteroidetes bacterium HGW-Bacteroidetes-6]
MKDLSVYILTCADDSFYTGVTNNVPLRVFKHNEGLDKKSYTYSRRPVVLSWASEPMETLYAIAFEKKIKGWSRKKKQALIDGEFDALVGLSKKKFKKK